ncbi:MAG: RlmE family RNA methyltransferase [Deltaproteobacteria bacterium]|nr:RlmE family RNA methyltransferase [Deltaproteobacteria bacterium]
MSYRPQDVFFHKAKREGYRSRAAYKLLEINQRFRLIRAGHVVVDLGAAPGGWLQVAAELAGPRGRVLGFDLQAIQPLSGGHVQAFELDVLADDAAERIRVAADGAVDCVLSDMAPRLSGIRDTDHQRALELTRGAFDIACAILKPRGSLLFKTFTGVDAEALRKEMTGCFQTVQRVRSVATRKGSSEIYVVAKGFKGGR